MLDLKFVRENPEIVKQNIKNKFQDQKLPLVDEVIALDVENRKAQQEADALRSNRKTISKQIGALMAQGKREEAEELKNKVKEIFKGTFICLKEKGYNADIIPIISVGDIKERKNIEEALITPVIRKITEQYIFFTEQYNKKYAEQSKRSGLNNLFHKKKKNDLMVQKNEDDMKRRDFKALFRIMDNAFKVNKN